MEDLKDYDNAVIKFRKRLKYSTLPLLSWDFYTQGLDAIKKTAEDMNSLLEFALANSWKIDTDLLDEKIKANKNVVVVTDAKLNIVFATKNIWDMNQYHPQDIIGKKPKMFQGSKTSSVSLKVISDAIKENKPFETTVINYRKDGSTYNCWIQGQPVFNEKGKVVNFIAFEKEVA
jgi:PAS domain S-box-containing protein